MSPPGPKKPASDRLPDDVPHHATWSPEDGLLVPPEDAYDPDSESDRVDIFDEPIDTDPPTEDADSLPPEDKIPPVEVARVRAPKGPAITAVPTADDDPSSSDSPPLPPETSDRYEVLDLLGRGGMGTVWRVRDTRLRRTLAMKVIHGALFSADALTRFAQEAQITGQLEHPTIVPVHDLGRTPDGAVYFTMKEVRGEALFHTLNRSWAAIDDGSASYDVVLVDLIGVMVRVCEAVAFAHARGVIHRDLKPDNVMVGEFGEVQVMDWGLARLLGQSISDAPAEPIVTSDREDSNPLRTRAGSVAGTPAYMAPEQARGEANQMGPHSDIWSLGAMLYEIVCGERAFEGAAEDVLRRVKAGEVIPPSERVERPISRELEAAVLRAMHPDPRQRYGSAEALRADLQAWLNGRPLAIVQYTARERVTKWARRNRSVVTAVAATALVAVALLGWGAYRYLQDMNAALDVAQAEADRARAAERQAQIRLAEGQFATADALAATERFVEARKLYRDAIAGLAERDRPTLGPELGLWGTYHRSRGPIGPLDGVLLGVDSGGGGALVQREAELVEVSVPQGRRRAGWEAPPGEIVHVAHDDGAWWVYTHEGGAIHLRRAGEKTAARLFALPDDGAIRVTPSGDRVLSHTAKGGATLWTAGDAGSVGIPLADDLIVMHASDDHAILSRYGQRTELWALGEPALVRQLSTSYGRAMFTPDGRTVVVHYEPDDVLVAEDVATGEVRWSIPADYLNPHGFTRDGRLLLAAGLRPGISVIDMATGGIVGRMDGRLAATRRVLVTDDVVLSYSDQTLVWGLPGAAPPLGQVIRLEGDLMEVDIDTDAGLIVGVGTRGVRLWDLHAGVELPGWPLDGEARDVQLDAQGERALVTLIDQDRATVLDLVTGERTDLVVPSPMSGTFLGDDVVALGGSDGAVRAISLRDGETRWRHPAVEGEARWDLQFDPERKALYGSAFHAGRIDVFDPETGAVRRTLETGTSPYTVRIDPATGRVATGNAARTGLVFEADGRRVGALTPHDGPVLGQAFSPDGSMVATADFAGPMRVFATGGQLMHTDRVQSGPLVRIWWPEPRRLVSLSGDTALVRDLDAPQRLAAGAGLLGDGPGSHAGQLADLVGMHGLLRHAAELHDEAGSAPMVRTRAWWLAGDPQRARDAFAQADAGSALHAGWQRLLDAPAVSGDAADGASDEAVDTDGAGPTAP